MMIEPDWIWGLVGGLMIGSAAAAFLLINGHIMGASGLIGGLIDGSGRSNLGERAAFIAGLIIVPGLIALTQGNTATNASHNLAVLVLAGLAVGVGTRLANGCTSGHGVCGISRLSMRGIVATLFYLLAGGLTVLAFRHLVPVI
jgi:uncharacterized membrane protein YedE/YeeE